MTPEAKVKNRVKKVLRELGIYFAMPASGGYGNSGTPDFLCCYRGLFIAIETKANGGRLTALQESHLRDIVTAGGVGMVIDEHNVDGLANELKAQIALNIYERKGD